MSIMELVTAYAAIPNVVSVIFATFAIFAVDADSDIVRERAPHCQEKRWNALEVSVFERVWPLAGSGPTHARVTPAGHNLRRRKKCD